MEGRATAGPSVIDSDNGDELPVLATDRPATFGAALCCGVDPEGCWFAEAMYARRESSGRWLDMGTTPWRPPQDGWDRDPLLMLGRAGLTVEDANGCVVGLDAVYGFATPVVRAIEVPDGERRVVPLDSPVGAFIVVRIGRGSFGLTASDGVRTIGPSRKIE